MDVLAALQARKSVRAFLDKPVSQTKIDTILDAARWAPSGTNTQPWQVAVVMGDKKAQIQQALEAAFRAGQPSIKDYPYYPSEWIEPFITRRRICGQQLYSALNIQRHDKTRRLEQWVANYRAFEAPVMLFFFIHKIMERGSYLDYGMFLQSIMLAAVDQGLATCAQAALAEYPDIIRQSLEYSDEYVVVCGMALGYEDTHAAVNHYRTTREPITHFVKYYDSDFK